MEKATFQDEAAICIGTFVRTNNGECGMVDSIFVGTPIEGYGFVTSDEMSWTEKIVPFDSVSICDDDNVVDAYEAAISFYKNEIEHLQHMKQTERVKKHLAQCVAFLDYLQPHIAPDDNVIRNTDEYAMTCEKINSCI